MAIDLHVHTTSSDGTESPEKVVFKVRNAGLEAVSITDHDTLSGVEPAMAAGKAIGLEVISGVELGALQGEQEIHILGYLLDHNDRTLLEKLGALRSGRLGRMDKMVEKLRQLGYPVTIDRVLAISGHGSVGRPHLAAALVEAGSVETMGDAFKKLIGKGCPAYIPRYKLSPAEAVQIIKRAGGVPVLAHPGLDNASSMIDELIPEGLQGLEAYHPSHTRELASYFERLAKRKGLLATGGSDYHGPGHKEGCFIGASSVPYSVLTELKTRREHHSAN